MRAYTQKNCITYVLGAHRVCGTLAAGTLAASLAAATLATGVFASSAAFGQEATPAQNLEIVTPQTSAQAAAQAVPAPTAFNAANPEGKTLPAQVARFRVVTRFSQADSGFDDKGERSSSGFTHQLGVNAFVSEMALNERLSLQFMVPVVFRNRISFDAKAFKHSALFKSKYNAKANAVAEKLRKNHLCKTPAQCHSLIARGASLPMAQHLALDSGETISVGAGRPLREAIEDTIVNTARPQADGADGLGDVEAGVLYNFYRSDKLSLASGLGLRLPTADYNLPEGQRPLSHGVTDMGVRFNIDYAPVPGLWLSLQQKLEHAISSSNWQRPSDLSINQFNLADPNDGGDGKANERHLSKLGLTSETQLKANYGLAAVSSTLKPLAMNVSYQRKADRAIVLDGQEYRKRAQLDLVAVGASASGLAYRIPLELELNYAWPVAGKNARLAPATTEASVKLYTRF